MLRRYAAPVHADLATCVPGTHNIKGHMSLTLKYFLSCKTPVCSRTVRQAHSSAAVQP